MDNIIYGRNAVIEFLKTKKDINKAYILEGSNSGSIREIISKLKEKKVNISFVGKSKLDELTQFEKHQGVVISASLVEYCDVEDILELAKEKKEDPFIVILDGIEDPHNFGAIIRSANIFGVHGIIIKTHGSVGVTPVVAKASAGAINHTLIARVTNLNNTIKKLKKAGLWIVCSDMASQTTYNSDLTGAIAIIIGNEGKGVSKLVKENADFGITIPMVGEINSFNASVSTGIILYEVFKQKNPKWR